MAIGLNWELREGNWTELQIGINYNLAAARLEVLNIHFYVWPSVTSGFVTGARGAEGFTLIRMCFLPSGLSWGSARGHRRDELCAGTPSTDERGWQHLPGELRLLELAALPALLLAAAVISITMAMLDELPVACPARSLGTATAGQTRVGWQTGEPGGRWRHVLLPRALGSGWANRGRDGALSWPARRASPSPSLPGCLGSSWVVPAAAGPLCSTATRGSARRPAREPASAGPRAQSRHQPAAPNAVSIGARLH